MRGPSDSRAGFTQVFAVLAFVAIAMRALIPAGYMVSSADDGRFVSIVLCSGHQAVLDLDSGHLVDQGQTPGDEGRSGKNADLPCVFAAAAHLSTPEASLAAPAPLPAYAERTHEPMIVAPGRGLAAPPPWATGPPLTL